MKKYFFLIISFLITECSANKGVYWCGDHPCINKEEKEAYFKKTMIVEVRNYDKNKIKQDSEFEKLLKQAKLDNKKRILSEKDEKKQLKLEEKKRIQEEKELAKQLKLEEKKRIQEEKETSKVVKLPKHETKEKKILAIETHTENVEIGSDKFQDLAKEIIKRNSSRPYPEINDIPN